MRKLKFPYTPIGILAVASLLTYSSYSIFSLCLPLSQLSGAAKALQLITILVGILTSGNGSYAPGNGVSFAPLWLFFAVAIALVFFIGQSIFKRIHANNA